MVGKKNKFAVKGHVYVLPNETEENIFSRVPVKTILRFMSVCKSWYSLFHEPYFINLHLKNNKNNISNGNNIPLLMRVYKARNRLPALVVTDTSSVVHSRLVLDPQLDETKIIASCDGIVCVQSLRRCSDGVISEHIYLWNPALRVVKNVKICEWCIGQFDPVNIISKRMVLGFGFDSRSMDHKVIRFHKSNVPVLPKQVEIYSLTLDSWRTVKVVVPQNIMDFFLVSRDRSEGVCVKGVHHWIHSHKFTGSMAIVSFDMGEEALKETMMPIKCTKRDMHKSFMTQLFNYNESLAMIILSEEDLSYYIWVMNDTLPESWTMLCKIHMWRWRWRVERVYFQGFVQMKKEVIFSRLNYRTDQERLIVFDMDKSEVNYRSSTAYADLLKDATGFLSFKDSLLLLDSNNLVHLY